MKTAALLTISNVFMTFAWYGNLKFKDRALWLVILVSWLIAGVEYCFAVPANRIGHNAGFSLAQLKTLQEVITLGVFCIFSLKFFPDEHLGWNYFVAFGLLVLAVFFVFHKW